MAISDIVDWTKGNILATVVIVLTVLFGIGGLVFLIGGIFFIEKYVLYDMIFLKYEDEHSIFAAFGVWMIFTGILMCIGLALVISVVLKGALCFKIYFLIYLYAIAFIIIFCCLTAYEFTHERSYGEVKRALNRTFFDQYVNNALPVTTTTTTLVPEGVEADKTKGEVDEGDKTDSGRGELELRASSFFDTVHKELACCGIEGPADFTRFTHLPKSCCKTQDMSGECHETKAYQQGCKKALMDSLIGTATVITGISGFYSVVNYLTAVCFSVLVCKCESCLRYELLFRP